MMYRFFSFFSLVLIISLFALGVVTLSDVFIHANTLKFQVLTIVFALIFAGMGLIGLFVYKNFNKLYMASFNMEVIQGALKKLMLVFGIMALFITFAVIMFLFALLQRIISGTALLG